jgi:hypothetical protein
MPRLEGKRVIGLNQFAKHVGDEYYHVLHGAVFVSQRQNFGGSRVGLGPFGDCRGVLNRVARQCARAAARALGISPLRRRRGQGRRINALLRAGRHHLRGPRRRRLRGSGRVLLGGRHCVALLGFGCVLRLVGFGKWWYSRREQCTSRVVHRLQRRVLGGSVDGYIALWRRCGGRGYWSCGRGGLPATLGDRRKPRRGAMRRWRWCIVVEGWEAAARRCMGCGRGCSCQHHPNLISACEAQVQHEGQRLRSLVRQAQVSGMVGHPGARSAPPQHNDFLPIRPHVDSTRDSQGPVCPARCPEPAQARTARTGMSLSP